MAEFFAMLGMYALAMETARSFAKTVQIGDTMDFSGHGLDEMDLSIEISRV